MNSSRFGVWAVVALVRTLVAGEAQAAGRYTYVWRGQDDEGRVAASGVYVVELVAGGARRTSKVTRVR